VEATVNVQHLSQIRGMYVEKARLAAELLCTIAASGLQEVTQGEREELSRAASVLQRLQNRLREVREAAKCHACSVEAEFGTEEDPHPIPPMFHTCKPIRP
jgi:hypothetical protein